MLIHDFMPGYDVSEHHHLEVQATREAVYAALQSMDFSRSRVIRLLFALRSLPAILQGRQHNKTRASLGLDLPGLLETGFILLGQVPQQEFVLGLIGKFWTTSGCLQKVHAQEFRDFTTRGFAKAVWNFSLQPVARSRTMLATETRVLCLDENSRRRFRYYWMFIRPFSGWIRMEALRCLKRQAEEIETANHGFLFAKNFASKA
ncbi:MAG: hypothetical protein ACREOO_03345 [bacterium]